MTIKDLDPKDQEFLAVEDRKVRTILRQFMELVKDTDFVTWETWSSQTINPLLGKLGADEVIPNSTHYQGSQDLTVADLDAVRTIAKQMYAIAQDNLPLIARAIGLENTQ